ncbi:MAG: hypothetical protein Q8Q33_07210 [Chlamydiota bacterium]|nr:hypothetical protein [Chlamydiota bacterium]
MNKDKCAVDSVYYHSTPWEFHIVETDIETVREYFNDPKRCAFYVNNVHKNPFYCMERSPYEFSNFVQLKQSPWTRFGLVAHFNAPHFELRKKDTPNVEGLQFLTTEEIAKNIVEGIHRDCSSAWDRKKHVVAFLSETFNTRAMLFGYENTGDTLYYELYENGFWKESFVGGLYDPNVSTSTTFCDLKSVIRPDCKTGMDEQRFVEETFSMWKVVIPFISLVPYEKNPHLIKGSIPFGSFFTYDDIKGFDCALINELGSIV